MTAGRTLGKPVFVLLAALAMIPATAAGAAPRDAGDITAAISGLQKRYASVKTITADFEQTYKAPGISQTESGKLYMKKPGLMCWEYSRPEVKLFVADGRRSYLYTPEDRQVLVRKFTPEEFESTPLQFLLGKGDILKSFSASWEHENRPRVEGTLLIRLVPREPRSDYAYVVIEIDGRTYDLRRIVIRERTGNTSEYLLSDLAVNVKIDDKKFRFKIPKGAQVVQMDDK